MRKLLGLILGILLITNLSALTLGAGIGLEDLGNDVYLQIKGDAILPIVSFLDYRVGLLIFNFKDKDITLGTGIDNDVLVKISVPFLFQLYIPCGFSLYFNDAKSLNLNGGVGLEKELGFLKGYLEGGLRYYYFKIGGTSQSKTRFYLQGGIRIPLEIL
ncbi:MAG: hypothetical protein ABIK76_06050 [candidate division WOR-3 bacterium]